MISSMNVLISVEYFWIMAAMMTQRALTQKPHYDVSFGNACFTLYENGLTWPIASAASLAG